MDKHQQRRWLAIIAFTFIAFSGWSAIWPSSIYVGQNLSPQTNGANFIAALNASSGNIVTNGQVFFTPEMFGAVGDGISDDSLPMQLAINAAQAAYGGTVQLAPKTYAITTNLVATNAFTMQGSGVYPTPSSWTNSNVFSLSFPTVFPFLRGSVILQNGTNMDGIDCYNLVTPPNFKNFGIRFGTNVMFNRAGHGIACFSVPLFPNTNFDNGPQHADWENLYVFGSGSNSFGFFIRNGLYNNFTHLQCVGGGGFKFQANSQSPYNGATYFPGNFTLSESDFFPFVDGQAGGVVIESTNGSIADHILLSRVQTVIINNAGNPFSGYVNISLPASFQYTNKQNSVSINGHSITLLQCAFENVLGGGPADIANNTGGHIYNTTFYEAGAALTNYLNLTQNGVDGEGTPDYLPEGLSFGRVNTTTRFLIRLLDWGDASGSGPFMQGFGLGNNNISSDFMPGSASANGWTLGFWDVAQTTHTLLFHAFGNGMLTNSGPIVSGANGFSNSIASSVSSGTSTMFLGNPSQGYAQFSTYDGFQDQNLSFGFNSNPSLDLAQNANLAFASVGLSGGGIRFGGTASGAVVLSDQGQWAQFDGMNPTNQIVLNNVSLNAGNGQFIGNGGSLTNIPISGLTGFFYTGSTNIPTATTSLVIQIGRTVSNTNYIPNVAFMGGALALGTTASYSARTTTSFTLNLSAAITGGEPLAWSIIYSP